MLQIFRKDNGGLWGEMRAKKKAVLAAAPPATDDNSGGSYLFEPSGASGGSLDDSLWGDKAWSNKLSYNRMRNVLNTMKQLRGAGGKTRQGRFSISGSVGSNLFTSLRRISLSSAGGRQNSINSISEESSSAPKSVSIFCCCFSRAKVKSEGTVSKLNAVLGKYDEVADIEIPVRVNSTPLYPAATFSQKPSAKSIKFGTTDGGDGSAIAPSEAEVLAANTRQNRRVSFSETGYGGESPGALSTQSRKSLGGSSVKVAPFVAADTSSVGTGAGVCSVDTGVETAGSRKARRGSNASMSSFGSSKQQIGVAPGVGGSTKGARSGSISGGAGGSSSSSRKRGKPTRDEDLSDSDDEGAGDDVDDRSVVSVTSLLKRVSSFGLLSGASVEQDPNAHPKYCMCGCRRY